MTLDKTRDVSRTILKVLLYLGSRFDYLYVRGVCDSFIDDWFLSRIGSDN